MNQKNSLTNHLRQARKGCLESRNLVGRWLLNHVKMRVEALAKRQPLPDSNSAISSEVLIKLVKSNALVQAPNRRYLIGATTQALVEVIADTARRLDRKKRKSSGHRIPAELMVEILQAKGLDVTGLADAIQDLAAQGSLGARRAQVVVLRYFGGLRVSEIADELGVSLSTVESDWRAARVWLFKELHVDESMPQADKRPF